MSFDRFLERFMSRLSTLKRPWLAVPRLLYYLASSALYRGSRQHLSKAYNSYLSGAHSPKNADRLIIGSNFYSKGRQRDKLVDSLCKPFPLDVIDNLKSALPEFDIRESVRQLQTSGFCKLPVYLPQDSVDALQDVAKTGPVKPGFSVPDMSLRSEPNSEIAHIWDIPFEIAIKSNVVQQIIQDKQLLTLAGLYLECLPVVIGSRLYWSLAHDKVEFQTPENWHVDGGDGLRFVKVFIALSEVTKESGPTAFIEGSNKSLPRKFYSGRRFHEKEISRRFPIGSQIEATGHVGSIYFCDTRGLHRGTPVKNGKRLLFHFLYGSDFFGVGRPTTFGLAKTSTFGDQYSGELGRTFAAFRSDSPKDTSLIPGP